MDNERGERIEAKLDHVGDNITGIKVDIAEIKKDINHHIKRTDVLESMVLPVFNTFTAARSITIFFIKLSGVLVAAVGFIAAVTEILIYLNK